MYTEDIARNMSCILSNEMKDKMLAIYKGEVPSVIAFEEYPKCIASDCEHWKFYDNNIHGYCGALDDGFGDDLIRGC